MTRGGPYRYRPQPDPPPEPGPDYLTLPATAVTFRTKFGAHDYLETSSSVVLFARLHAAATLAQIVTRFEQGGREMTADSLAALNCYHRSARIGRCGLPWHSTTVTRNRHDWRAFVAHLGLEFK